ncbi:flavin reductase family protein [Actinokineospora sp. HUAS TT18]|uniref:flavin reductase family protein n=1 Tax=Actinokineospora sp. HUAS TT18 TaxID=3447451 RepID=UPI003F51F344
MTSSVAEAVWTVAQRFPTGVSVVTAGAGATARGATVSTFCFLSREPALVSICLRRGSWVLGLIRDHGAFTVNVLASDQEAVARRFASRARGADQFDGVGWTAGEAGVPRLADTVCWLHCRPHEVIAAGDHELVVATVAGLGEGPGRTPLLYFAGALHRGAIESEDI